MIKSKENIPQLKLKTGVKLRNYSPTAQLLDVNFIGKAIAECLFNDDIKSDRVFLANRLKPFAYSLLLLLIQATGLTVYLSLFIKILLH